MRVNLRSHAARVGDLGGDMAMIDEPVPDFEFEAGVGEQEIRPPVSSARDNFASQANEMVSQLSCNSIRLINKCLAFRETWMVRTGMLEGYLSSVQLLYRWLLKTRRICRCAPLSCQCGTGDANKALSQEKACQTPLGCSHRADKRRTSGMNNVILYTRDTYESYAIRKLALTI